MLEGGARRNRGNLALWIAVVVMSIIGLGANVYKANTGEKLEWASTIAELACLIAAGYFIYDYIRKKRNEKEGEKE